MRYVATPSEWVVDLAGVARIQQALLTVISELWHRGHRLVQTCLWALLRAWLGHW